MLKKEVPPANIRGVAIGADIAKQKHVVRVQDIRGIMVRPITFENSRNGFMRLLTWFRNLLIEYDKQEVLFGVELLDATGIILTVKRYLNSPG